MHGNVHIKNNPMFNDTPEGTTHSFEDSCQPPHDKPLEPVEDENINISAEDWAVALHGVYNKAIIKMMVEDLLHRHEAHVNKKWEREIVEKCQNVYRPYSELHDPKSNTCPCCVFDEAIEDIISLITKKDV